MEMTYNSSKVDLALAALAKLPADQRKAILDGLKEIVGGYASKSENVLKRENNVAFAWWIWD